MISPQTIVGGRYRVVRALGGGGMKLVYLAEDLRLAARRCALAEMVDSFTSAEAQQQATAAFQREADMLAQLSNEHIPRVFDRFSEANHHFLVMEYIDGITLEEQLKHNGGQLLPERVIDIAIQVLDTLEYLHHLEPPVIYRDLKPSNIMLTAAGQAKLIDFGIARHFQPFSNATMIGTQGYAPPEQYRGKVETRSDIYALGATMHQAVSGRDPGAEAPFSFPPLRKLCPDIDARLANAVDQALAYDLANRVPDAAEFKRRLLEIKTDPSHSTSAAANGPARSAAAAPRPPRASSDDVKGVPQPTSAAPRRISAQATHEAPTVLSLANEIACPACTRPIPADSRFCSYCAADLRVSETPRAPAPNEETVLLSAGHSPPAANPALGSYPPRYWTGARPRSGLRHPVVVLALIFAAGVILVILFRVLSSENTMPSGYRVGDGAAGPPLAHGAAVPGADLGNMSSVEAARLAALRTSLDQHGFIHVKFRLEDGTLVLSGSVPSDFDRASVQLICFVTTGITSLQDNLVVTGDDPDD